MRTRADRNRNPAAFTTALAAQAGLRIGIDWEPGDPFPLPSQLVTARLLGDPVTLTIQVIDAVGYYTKSGTPRWSYIAMPQFVWQALSPDCRREVVAFHYQHEGGSEMLDLFKA